MKDAFADFASGRKGFDLEDVLLSLKEADVGAIYLGKASTQFSLQNEEHHTNGIIRLVADTGNIRVQINYKRVYTDIGFFHITLIFLAECT